MLISDFRFQVSDFRQETEDRRQETEYGIQESEYRSQNTECRRQNVNFPGRAVRYLTAPPQNRTSGFLAYGSSQFGFADRKM